MAANGRLETLADHLAKNSAHISLETNLCKTTELERTSENHHGPLLQVHPKSALNDELLDVRVKGLTPGQKVTLRAHVFTECGKYRFESRAEYVADGSGQVTVQKDPSLGGCYTGVEPMGLIWGVEPSPEGIKDWPRLVKKNISEPFVYHFRVSDEEGRELAASSVERWFLADYVERILVTHGKADGCLYLPKQKGLSDPLPVLIDVRGGVHFLVEDRPALMASHGFATFSLNYYRKMKGKTELWTETSSYFDMQIFVDVFDFIRSHPRLDINRVGMVSSCLGSSLSLNAAARLKHLPIKCIAATGCADQLSWSVGIKLLDGTLIEPCGTEYYGGNSTIKEDGDLYWQISDTDYDDIPDAPCTTPVQDVTIPMLFFVPQADLYVPSKKCMNRMIGKIEKAGHRHLLTVVPLEGAGHYIDAPYLCHCKHANIAKHHGFRVFSTHGGELRLHAYALETTWRKTINWFRQQLNVTEIYRDDWLDPQPQHIPSTRV